LQLPPLQVVSFLWGALISKKKGFSEQKILALTAFETGLSIFAAIFGMLTEAAIGLFYLQGIEYIISMILALSAGGIFYMPIMR
jgi:hypothetical protein